MAKLTEQDFKREVSLKNFKKVYLIDGDEKYLVKKYTEALVNKIAGKNPSEFDLTRLNSSAGLEEISSAAEQISMFNEYKCVLVTDYDVDALNESDYKLLEQLISDIVDGAVVVFSMPTLGESQKKSGGKVSKRKKFAAAVAKYGTVLELQKKGDIALEQQLVRWAEKANCTLSRINAAKMIAMSGTDMTTLKNEMDKLTAYVNGGEITEEIIKKLVVKNTEVRIFALSDCISKGDFNGAFRQLHSLLEQNEKPEIILSVLSSTYIDMYRMRVASESGVSAAQVAADFKYGKRDFVLRNAANNSKKYSTEMLRACLDIIIQTDMKLKSARVEPRILLETLISKLMVATRGERCD